MRVEVVYALPPMSAPVTLDLPEGATVREAIAASGVLDKHPEITLGEANKIGVFGKLVALNTVLHEHDRVEIYRPLLADPKEVRRRRVLEKRAEQRRARS